MADWYDTYAETYDHIERGVAGDEAFYLALAAAVPPPVLELGCGTGRITIPIARAGIAVVGLDRSPRMLEVARRKAAGLHRVRWVEADMRSFSLPERFGLICIPFRSFQHLLTREDQQGTLARCMTHLIPGGLLALNLANPPLWLLTGWGGRVRPVSTLLPGRRLRLVTPPEMGELLHAAGFVVRGAYGDFAGGPLTPKSTEQVWLARRP